MEQQTIQEKKEGKNFKAGFWLGFFTGFISAVVLLMLYVAFIIYT